MGIFDLFFGGTDDSAQDAQIFANREARAFIEDQSNRAREDVNRLFPQAQQNLLTGVQGALDVFGQTIPQQLGAFQTGNVGAQQALLAGLPQQNNALLGLPTDLSGLQAMTIPVNSGFSQQQAPLPVPQTQVEPEPEPSSLTDALPGEFSQNIPGLLAGNTEKFFGDSSQEIPPALQSAVAGSLAAQVSAMSNQELGISSRASPSAIAKARGLRLQQLLGQRGL